MTDLMRSLKMHSTPNVQIPDSAEVKFMRVAIKSALVEIERLRAALKPFAEVEVEGMLSLEEANLDKEDFYRARAAYSHEQKDDDNADRQ